MPQVAKRVPNLILTREIGKAICKHVATGTPKKYAASAEGVAYSTIDEWLRRGEGRDDRPATPLMKWFAREMRRAEALDLNRRKVRLEAIAETGDPRVDMWWLERRYPDEFGRPADRVEIAGAGGGAIQVTMAFDASPIVAAVAARRALERGGVVDVEAEEIT